MEQHDIQDLISHPENLDGATLLYLRELVARYPYFQTAWILYLKNLFILGDLTFKDELKRGALFVADLSLLFYYIEGERFLIKKHNAEDAELAPGTDRTLDLIDRFLAELPEQGTSTKVVNDMSIPVEMPGDYTSVLLSEVSPEEAEASPLHGQELIDQFLEQSEVAHSEIQSEGEASTLIEGKEDEVGEQHISATESVGEEPVEEIDRTVCIDTDDDNHEENDSEENYFTETLAKIYVRQQRYDKALEIIKKLNLKYPKKNAYFADQIRFLEKLIINAKSK